MRIPLLTLSITIKFHVGDSLIYCPNYDVISIVEIVQFSTEGMNVFFSPFSFDIEVKVKVVDCFEYGPWNIFDHYGYFSFSESSTFIRNDFSVKPNTVINLEQQINKGRRSKNPKTSTRSTKLLICFTSKSHYSSFHFSPMKSWHHI